jgi:hypothetical protein
MCNYETFDQITGDWTCYVDQSMTRTILRAESTRSNMLLIRQQGFSTGAQSKSVEAQNKKSLAKIRWTYGDDAEMTSAIAETKCISHQMTAASRGFLSRVKSGRRCEIANWGAEITVTGPKSLRSLQSRTMILL